MKAKYYFLTAGSVPVLILVCVLVSYQYLNSSLKQKETVSFCEGEVQNLNEKMVKTEELKNKIAKLESENMLLKEKIDQLSNKANKLLFNGQAIKYIVSDKDTEISEENNYDMIIRSLEFVQALSVNDTQKIKSLCTTKLYEEISESSTRSKSLSDSASTANRIVCSENLIYGYINPAFKINDEFCVGVWLELDNDSLYLDVSLILKDGKYLINSLSANR